MAEQKPGDQETLKSMVVQGLEATLEGLNEQRSKEGQGLKGAEGT